MKKFFAGLISLAAALFAVCAITVCAGAEVSGDYEYSVLSDGTVEITGYTGSDTDLTIPSALDGFKVTRIGSSAFFNYSSLISVIIPDSVTDIGPESFRKCNNLTSVIIPDCVKCIEFAAFMECSKLVDINIPDGVTCIDSFVFSNCSSLTSITLPDSVMSINTAAFICCSKLAEINIPDSVINIEDNVFEQCSSLTSITIPDGVTSIKYATFSNCSKLAEINIPDSVTSIEDYAFSGCSSLTSITIPDGVTCIKYGAFSNCSKLAEINIPDSVTIIEEIAFDGCSSFKSVTIPDSVNVIEWGVFRNCSSLASINIPDSVTSIEDYAFSGCSSLTSIDIPDGVTSIGNGTFYGCSSLTSITIPDSVTSIEDYAFHECSTLKDVYYTGSKAQWDKITIDYGNDELLSATINYDYGKVTAPSSVTGLKLIARAADTLRLTWDININADGYIIEMKSGSSWTRVGKITKNSTVEFKKSKLKAGTTYTFHVKAYKMNGKTALYSGYTTISARTNPSAVSGLKLKARAADALRLTWAKNDSADGYIIEMKSGNSWTRVGKITNNSTVEFKKSKLKAGTAYTFRVKAYKMSGKTALYGTAKTISVRTNPSAVSGLKLKNSAKDAVRLSWTKNTSADGYIIEMKVNGVWKRAGKIAKNTTIEFKKSGLKSKTSYTFRIKTYKMSGKTALYGTAKTITVKTK